MSFHKYLQIHSASILLALPRLFVFAALPPSLESTVPLCAHSCLEDFLQRDFASSACPDLRNIDCLCSHYGVDGYTIGEGAYACLYSSDCPQSTKSNGTSLYSTCSGRNNAVAATHRTIIVTAPAATSTTTSSSSSSARDSAQLSSTMTALSTARSPKSFTMQPTESPARGIMTMRNVSLTMAQIAGITIAAAALLILSVGIATCLLFVRRNKRFQDLEDHKIPLFPSPKPPHSQGPRSAQAPGDPKGGIRGVGIATFYRPTPESPVQSQPTWPRYYPIMPDDIGIMSASNFRLTASKEAAPPVGTGRIMSNSNVLNDMTNQTLLNPTQSQPSPRRQSTGIIPGNNGSVTLDLHSNQTYYPPPPTEQSPRVPLPQPPAAAYTEPLNALPVISEQDFTRRSSLRPMSAMTEFEDDDTQSPVRPNFAVLRPTNQFPFAGPQALKRESQVFPSPRRGSGTKSVVPPTLTLQIPKYDSIMPPPPPPPLQRPSLVHEDYGRSPQLGRISSQQDLQILSYSSAIASSQALGSNSTGSLAEQSSSSTSTQDGPSSKTGRDSQASFTSFESTGSEDDATPPKEEDRRLSPVQESPAAKIKYPKVPRAANQAVARSSEGPRTSSPRERATPAPISQGIGNRLWKTEKSPETERPNQNWSGRQDNWSWASEQSMHSTPNRHVPPAAIMIPPLSPFGVMPKLTPTRRGDDMFLSVNQ